jgi:hypothetical protein
MRCRFPLPPQILPSPSCGSNEMVKFSRERKRLIERESIIISKERKREKKG